MEADERSTISSAAEEMASTAKDVAQQTIEEGYATARQYADEGLDYISDVSEQVGALVRRDPWIAVAGAFPKHVYKSCRQGQGL